MTPRALGDCDCSLYIRVKFAEKIRRVLHSETELVIACFILHQDWPAYYYRCCPCRYLKQRHTYSCARVSQTHTSTHLCLFVWVWVCLSLSLSVSLSICLSVCLSQTHTSVRLSGFGSVCLCLSVCLCVSLCACVSVCLLSLIHI